VPPPASPSQPYGAPVRREGGTALHDHALADLLAPAPTLEPGEVDDHLVSLLAPTSPAAEQYRSVRLHVETLRRERGVHVVAVASPARGDGRTTSALNLAGALAQAPDARVALVEVDVRHPSVTRYLGLPSSRSLSGYLQDPTMSVDAPLERPAGVGFAVVAAGPASSMPYELLKSPRLAALVAALRERFDFVVVDTPPVFPFPDVGLVRPLIDGFVLVVRANRTPREMARDSLAALGPDRLLGVIFNDDERAADGAVSWRSYLGRPRGGSRAA
jgi:capsular exopolysaccharide synthesis family protein